jgi:hypothetical protein
MRVGLLLLGLALSLPASAPAQPDVVQYEAVVTQAEALVRYKDGEGPESYPTNALKRGAVVQVVEERGNGWLRILPPPGSFSWISKRYVQQPTTNQPVRVLTGSNVKVPVYVGSELKKDGRPTGEGMYLTRGAIVVAIGPALTDQDGAWLPIEPPVGEYRFIRADVVTRKNGPIQTGPSGPSPFNTAAPETAGTGTPGGANFQQPTLTIPPPGTMGVASNKQADRARIEAMYNQAVQADRAGQTADAIRLYTEVGTEAVGINQDLALQALNRAYVLRQGGRAQTVQGQPTRTIPTNLPDPVSGSRFTPEGTGTGTGTTAATPVNGPGSRGGYPYATGLGVLRPSTQRLPELEGRRVYLMLNRDGKSIAYVTPAPGVDLESYMGREVELFGQAVYRGDLKTNLMVVDRVQVGR